MNYFEQSLPNPAHFLLLPRIARNLIPTFLQFCIPVTNVNDNVTLHSYMGSSDPDGLHTKEKTLMPVPNCILKRIILPSPFHGLSSLSYLPMSFSKNYCHNLILHNRQAVLLSKSNGPKMQHERPGHCYEASMNENRILPHSLLLLQTSTGLDVTRTDIHYGRQSSTVS